MRTIWRRAKQTPDKRNKINEQIKSEEIFLIDENGDKKGKINTMAALAMAREAGLDLVEVNPKAEPPVAKIMDYGQIKYMMDKKAHKQKVQQKKVETKGIRLSVRISCHDFDFRLEQARKFLIKGHKLKIEIVLKGRERQHPAKAVEIINAFIESLAKEEKLNLIKEQDLTKMNGRFTILLVNKK